MYREKAKKIIECGYEGVELAGALVALALSEVAYELRCIGNGGAATPLGAIEALSMKIGETGTSIACALEDIADAQRGRE